MAGGWTDGGTDDRERERERERGRGVELVGAPAQPPAINARVKGDSCGGTWENRRRKKDLLGQPPACNGRSSESAELRACRRTVNPPPENLQTKNISI